MIDLTMEDTLKEIRIKREIIKKYERGEDISPDKAGEMAQELGLGVEHLQNMNILRLISFLEKVLKKLDLIEENLDKIKEKIS